ncbi:MAG: hypothetical protein AAGE18_17300 [Pseudomonadota bacterium]
MSAQDPEAPLAYLACSPGRRWLAAGMLFGLGLMILYLLAIQPPDAPAGIFLLFAVAAGALWLGLALYRATARHLVLTEERLADDLGEVLCETAAITRVERGLLAFKPSNGFVLLTREPGPFAWRPGLWWRIGRRIGIGGAAAGGSARLMADILQAQLAQRDGELP